MRAELSRLPIIAVLALPSTACFTAELDENQGGVFACECSNECGDGQKCVNGLCESEGDVPSLTIRAPERFVAFPASVPEDDLEIRVGGNLTLVGRNSGQRHVVGQGHVRVELDGVEVATIDSGPLSDGVGTTVPMPTTAGPHRIAARAFRNDGIEYDNPEALATNIIFIDDGRPAIAIVKPWPGQAFPLEATPVDFEFETIRFQVEPFALEPSEGRGHIHLYHERPFPDCALDQEVGGCDAQYFHIAESKTVTANLPDSAAKEVMLTASLRAANHPPYTHPFGSELSADTVIFEQIELLRTPTATRACE